MEACTQARLTTITLYPPGSEQLVCQEVMHRDTLKQVNGKLKPIFHDCFHPVPICRVTLSLLPKCLLDRKHIVTKLGWDSNETCITGIAQQSESLLLLHINQPLSYTSSCVYFIYCSRFKNSNNSSPGVGWNMFSFPFFKHTSVTPH